jgi:putative peptidoglycan lipid II flippase
VRDGVYKPDPGWLLYLVKIGLACVAMALVLYYGVENIENWATWNVYKRVFSVLLWVGIGAAVYLFMLVITGVKIKEIIRHG